MRAIEALFFLPVAAALHVVVWDFAPSSNGSLAAGGSGQDSVTLTAATAQQSAMVARWQKTPQVTSYAPSVVAAPSTSAPPAFSMSSSSAPALPSAPRLTAPIRTAMPQIDTQTAALPRAEAPQPVVRPKARTRTIQLQSQPAKQAAGRGQNTQRGEASARVPQSQTAARAHALQAKWGAAIYAKVQRNIRYPRSLAAAGTTKLTLRVARNGTLQNLKLMRSSGNKALDAAALRAVKRAGRFAKAPQGLDAEVYAFSLSLTFKQ